MTTSVANPQIELAYDYVTQTHKHIFLTGKAGTGKTTFLHRVKRETIKRVAVVAPTGVAAINAKGVTIHSLFQLPFGPIVPGKLSEQMAQRRFSGKKIDLIKSLDLLVIDEISMVRADVLDAIDTVLQRYRQYGRPFGGLQLLMIGDLHQLPPVVKQHEWDLLKDHYQTPYFFGSLALQKANPVTIELKHIYRQDDSVFIELLNKVRGNRMDAEVMETLNSRYQPDFNPDDKEGYITLSSHNNTARAINTEKLKKTAGKSYTFNAKIEGDFPAHAYPTEEELEFKINAQVMFVKNDLTEDKRFFNGKIGRITKIEKEEVFVLCPGETEEIKVTPLEWSNRKYSLDKATKEINEELIGTFIQYPLKLAWAITIHKSQGLTFERVVIDAQAAFAHGQVYVALSRCKTFEGIVLRSRLVPTSIKTDVVVRNYTDEAEQNQPGTEELLQARKEYQAGLLREFFQFKNLKKALAIFDKYIQENEVSLQGNIVKEVNAMTARADSGIFTLADKFLPQLEWYLIQPEMPDEHKALEERLQKAGTYFRDQLKSLWDEGGKELEILTDNKSVDHKAKEYLDELHKELFIQQACAKVFIQGFSSKAFIRMKVDAGLDFKPTPQKSTTSKAAPKNVANLGLYQQLVGWRDRISDYEKIPHYRVVSTRSILELVRVLPTNVANLKLIHGIGKSKAADYGDVLIAMIKNYSEEHTLDTDLLEHITSKASKEKKPRPDPETVKLIKATKVSSKETSFEMFKAGKTIAEIAKARGFTSGTIETHLGHFVVEGELDISEIMDAKKVERISVYFKTADTDDLAPSKEHFGDEFSYGELRLVREFLRKE